jgi:dUTP pyrophosphatase
MLTGEELRALGAVSPDAPLPDAAVQPNGVDLSLDAIWRIRGGGTLGVRDAERRLPEREPVPFDPDGWVALPPGAYGIRFAETVALPRDCGGLAFPRSSLLRMGVHVPTAVWDAGYTGRAESLLIVLAGDGLRLQRGARIAQLVLFRLSAVTAGYRGRYQGENLPGEETAGDQPPPQ